MISDYGKVWPEREVCMFDKNEWFFVLGADDPEMRRIEEILHLQSCLYGHACVGEERVNPGNAYYADSFKVFPRDYLGRKLVTIECKVLGEQSEVQIDHHRPGDFGYDKGPEEFWEASSLGQLFGLLGLRSSKEDLVLAAADHCFQAAIRGDCRGVDPEAVRALKLQGLHDRINDILCDVTDSLSNSVTFVIDGKKVAFLDEITGALGIGYSIPYLAAQFVAVEASVPVVLIHKMASDDRLRLHLCGGDVSPELVAHFIEEWGPKNNLVDLYGVPERGYAGGYLEGPFRFGDFMET